MRSPSAPGTPVDGKRYRNWILRFGSYRDAITNGTIENWLGQFRYERRDKDLAARILDVVEFYGQGQIHAAYRQSLKALPGWDQPGRAGHWRFAAMSGSAGESGDAMMYHFRLANQLTAKKYNSLFVSRADLFRQPLLPEGHPQKLGKNDVVVLLDDFSGTGEQVCKAWNDPETSFGALLTGVGKVYLVLVAASKAARERISKETSLCP